jgi:hypothetical protein
MIKFEKAEPPKTRKYHTKRQSGETIENFMASELESARLCLDEFDNSVYLSLKQFVRRHNLPIIVSKRCGSIYLLRDNGQD